ncbi:Malto-oligosyltrehalose trehalohydrolase [Rhodoplanes serenus]|uniref:Malto-oligosyltrehalose trehalohydrolase n=1 Tax=Rhodoplanes serenus TaxID=200615 RepID=A0A447CTL9_9BRAD|nr:malto-oligosyltrehalose trehalohydrolase [Rhodoplanes serenus]VCU08590.1 Malto-oligosyltrehalose trehalohydrolase [Rhodoplanes serenus]
MSLTSLCAPKTIRTKAGQAAPSIGDPGSGTPRGAPRFGPVIETSGTRFRLWAPKWTPEQNPIVVELTDGGRRIAMTPGPDGWHEAVVADVGVGSRYRFVLPDGLAVPDPGSRFQPDDVHGPSEVIDPSSHVWRHADWRGRPWHQAVIYELHVGTFTAEGTFRAAIDKLDHLVALGVTAIELMPIADFPGRRNWGYDGVLPFAPDSSYGRPEDLKALVDAAHGHGVMVLLDVVYNHFGPDGNYLPTYAPVFTDHHHTPWGAAVNFDAAGADMVRTLVVENAVYWIDEFRFDGLRLDAVHSILDDSDEHILHALARAVREAAPDRHIHLILENEENEAHLLTRDPDGTARLYTAQWNDDVHHVLHCAATGESGGYYADYAADTEKLGRALAEGFVFQGETMPYRGSPRGEPATDLPSSAFVSFIQNHDQIGNRAFGDRLDAVAPEAAVRAIAAVYLLLPQIPMLFMGEEWAAAQPFPFFCDFGPELSAAVRDGRAAEFARFPEFQDPASRARIPDPTVPETFQCAKLDWSAARHGAHAARLAFYRDLLAVRHREIVPRLRDAVAAGRYAVLGHQAVRVDWRLADGAGLSLLANLSAEPLDGVAAAPGRPIWTEGAVQVTGLGPWTVAWSLYDAIVR